jgi:hypothetical protein
MALVSILAGCSSDSIDRPKAGLSEGCLANTDCNNPLVCAFRRCHNACATSRDCPAGERCVASDHPYSVCQLADERDCSYNSQCPNGQLCGVDGQCRDQCATDRDCIQGQVCASGTCADPAELIAGHLPVKDAGPDAPLNHPCTYNSDCPAEMVCVGGTCRYDCLESRDCAFGLDCIAHRCGPVAVDAGDAPIKVEAGPETGTETGTETGPETGTETGPETGTDAPGDAVSDTSPDIDAGPSHCTNGKKDSDETGVDCGGSCIACDIGGECQVGKDCKSGVCKAGVCQAPTCADGVSNGAETDVDCGGPACGMCAVGLKCVYPGDCQTSICVGGQCRTPDCTDGIKNGVETDIDCGGGNCPKCDPLKKCLVYTDCMQGVCANLVCQAASCKDGVKNGDETDIDCGGSACGSCLPSKGCVNDTDCVQGICNTSTHVCDPPSCTDLIRNGTETDIDCGGGGCPVCDDGRGCVNDNDCAAKSCVLGACAPRYTLTVTKAGSGVGNVVSVPAGIQCGGTCTTKFLTGTSVTLTATPGLSSTFGGWSGGACSGQGTCTVVLNGDVQVTPTFDVSASGAVLWKRDMAAGGLVSPNAIAFDNSDSILIAGFINSGGCNCYNFGAGSLSGMYYLAKYASNGAYQWARKYGNMVNDGDGNGRPVLMVTSSQGDAFLLHGNTTANPVDIGLADLVSCPNSQVYTRINGATGATMWSRCEQGPWVYRMVLDADSNPLLFVSGSGVTVGGAQIPGPSGTGGADFTLARISAADGLLIWGKGFGGPGNQWVNDVAVDSSNNTLVTGGYDAPTDLGCGSMQNHGLTDIFAAKFSPTGDCLWSKHFGDNQTETGLSVAAAPDGDVIVAGEFNGPLSIGTDYFMGTGGDALLFRLAAADGAVKWVKHIGGPKWETAYRVKAGSNGQIVLAGSANEAVDLGGGPLTYNCGVDLFLARFMPDGSLIGAQEYGSGQDDNLSAMALRGDLAVGLGGVHGTYQCGGTTIDFGGPSGTISPNYWFVVLAPRPPAPSPSPQNSYLTSNDGTRTPRKPCRT